MFAGRPVSPQASACGNSWRAVGIAAKLDVVLNAEFVAPVREACLFYLLGAFAAQAQCFGRSRVRIAVPL